MLTFINEMSCPCLRTDLVPHSVFIIALLLIPLFYVGMEIHGSQH